VGGLAPLRIAPPSEVITGIGGLGVITGLDQLADP
jgi:hypothetical protein